MAQDLTLPAVNTIAELINRKNPKANFAPEELTLGAPTPVPPADNQGRNTSVLVTVAATENRGEIKQTFYYVRLNLAELLAEYDLTTSVLELTNTAALANYLNSFLEGRPVTLKPEDLLPGIFDEASQTATIHANPASLIWIGTTYVPINGG